MYKLLAWGVKKSQASKNTANYAIYYEKRPAGKISIFHDISLGFPVAIQILCDARKDFYLAQLWAHGHISFELVRAC